MRKNLHKFTQLSSQFSPKIRICFRCNMKHSEECFITYPNTSKCVKKTLLRLVFSTHFSLFGYETLFLVFHILHKAPFIQQYGARTWTTINAWSTLDHMVFDLLNSTLHTTQWSLLNDIVFDLSSTL